MASERLVVEGTIDYWTETGGDDCNQFAVVLKNGAQYDPEAAHDVFGKVVANGKRLRLIIELPEGE